MKKHHFLNFFKFLFFQPDIDSRSQWKSHTVSDSGVVSGGVEEKRSSESLSGKMMMTLIGYLVDVLFYLASDQVLLLGRFKSSSVE